MPYRPVTQTRRTHRPPQARQRGYTFRRVLYLLVLLFLAYYIGTPEWGWAADTQSIFCDKGDGRTKTERAIFAYSVSEQGIQLPGSAAMFRRNIPERVYKLWVENNRFLVIYNSSPHLYCDNFDETGHLPTNTRCEGHRLVPGYDVLTYSQNRFRYWRLKGDQWRSAQSIDYEPSAQPTQTFAGCEPSFSYLQLAYVNIKAHLVFIWRQF